MRGPTIARKTTPFRFEAVAVVKGVPAAALAYHNPSGVLVDYTKTGSIEEARPDFGHAGGAGGRTAHGQIGVGGETAPVGGHSGGDDGGIGGASIETVSSRFRCHSNVPLYFGHYKRAERREQPPKMSRLLLRVRVSSGAYSGATSGGPAVEIAGRLDERVLMWLYICIRYLPTLSAF